MLRYSGQIFSSEQRNALNSIDRQKAVYHLYFQISGVVNSYYFYPQSRTRLIRYIYFFYLYRYNQLFAHFLRSRCSVSGHCFSFHVFNREINYDSRNKSPNSITSDENPKSGLFVGWVVRPGNHVGVHRSISLLVSFGSQQSKIFIR